MTLPIILVAILLAWAFWPPRRPEYEPEFSSGEGLVGDPIANELLHSEGASRG